MNEKDKLEKLYDSGINSHFGNTYVYFETNEPVDNQYCIYDKSSNKYICFSRPIGIPYNIRLSKPKNSTLHNSLKREANRRTRHSKDIKQHNEYKKDFDIDFEEF